MTEKYDIAIIGSGLGGLSCGVILSKEGFKVCIIEQHSVVGGCLQSFKRNNTIFDTGIHYIGSMGKGQIMRQFMRYYGVDDKIKTMSVDSDAYETICIDSEQYQLPIGAKQFVDKLGQQFPEDKLGLSHLISKIMEVKNSIGIEQLRAGHISDASLQHYISVSAYQTIAEHINNPILQNILGSSSLLFGGEKQTANFYHYAMVMGSNIEGAHHILGGTQTIANAMANVIKQNGGTIITSEAITNIITSRTNEVQYLKTSKGREIKAQYYISSAHPQVTFDLVEPTPIIKKPFLNRIKTLRNTYGMFSVYLTLKRQTIPFKNTFYFIHANQSSWFDEDAMKGRSGESSLMLSFRPSEDGKWAESATLITPISPCDYSSWTNTHINHRGSDYEMWKKSVANIMISRAQKVCSGLSDAITHIYTASPLTFRDYTFTPQGSAYGLVKNYQNPLPTTIPTQTKLRNLLLTGQNVFVPGAIGVTMTAAMTCANIIGEEYLAKKIAEA